MILLGRGLRWLDATGGWSAPISFEVESPGLCALVLEDAVVPALARACAGLTGPTEGHLEVLGRVPAELSSRELRRWRRRMGVALSPPGLAQALDLTMNVALPLIYDGVHLHAAEQQAEALLAAMELLPMARRLPREVPQPVRRQVVVARALVRRPQLALLEEPAEGLDPRRAERLAQLCAEHAETTVALTSQADSPFYRAAVVHTTHASALNLAGI